MRLKVRFLGYLAVATTTCLVLLYLALPNNYTPAALHQGLQSFKAGWSSPFGSSTTIGDGIPGLPESSTTIGDGLPGLPESSTTIGDGIPGLPESPTAIEDGVPGLSATPAQDEYTIRHLWRDWSKVFEDARPQAGKIRLRSHAGNVQVEDHPGKRAPDTNRVANPDSDIQNLTTAHAAFVSALQSPLLDQHSKRIYNGTGIVIVGGGEYFGPAIVGLQMLRKTGCTLPVEVFVADASEYEKDVCDGYLATLGAKCLVLSDYLESGDEVRAIRRRRLRRKTRSDEKDPSQTKSRGFEVTHYQLKSLAILFSSFAHVLYLDSDSIPLVNPTLDLFSVAPYNTEGLVIWPDFWIASESPAFWSIAGLSEFPQNLPKSSSEAGQLLINKHTHLKTLLLANYYNVYGPDYYYPLLSQGALGQGDKETFLAAAVALNESWYRVLSPVAATGRTTAGVYKGSGMIQHDPGADLDASLSRETNVSASSIVRPAFLHANTPKMNAGHLVDEGDLVDSRHNTRLRLWGSKESQQELYGADLEKNVWEFVVTSGCELQHVIREWKQRDKLCDRLKEHFTVVFGATSIVTGGHTTRWREKPQAGV